MNIILSHKSRLPNTQLTTITFSNRILITEQVTRLDPKSTELPKNLDASVYIIYTVIMMIDLITAFLSHTFWIASIRA